MEAPDRTTTAPAKGRRARRWRIGLAALALALVAVDQLVLRVALADGYLGGRRVAPFDPPIFNAAQAENLARLRQLVERGPEAGEALVHDAELGWAPPKGGTFEGSSIDWAGTRVGARELAREKRGDVRRVVAVGCSYTFGDEVEGREAWPAVLDELRADLEVGNLGMGAYGVDQALLRYLRDGRPLAPDEVWLGLFPSATVRVLSVHWPIANHWSHMLHFKPRFELDSGGELQLVPNPARTPERALHLMTHQADYFAEVSAHDAFARRFPAAYAPEGARLLHHSGLARLALSALEYRGRDPFELLRDEEGEAFRLVVAICRRLGDEAARDGARLRVVIVPGARELEQRRAGAASWDALAAALAAAGIEVLDLSADLPGPGAPEWRALWAERGHYSALGNRLVAEALDALLQRNP